MATMQQTRPWRTSNFPVQLKQPPLPKFEQEEAPRYSGDEDEEVSLLDNAQEESNHFTKNGKPDRRYKGQRDLPDEQVINPGYRRASTAHVVQGVHVTKDGSPDRRYKENRTISDEEAEVMKARLILKRHGAGIE